MNSDASSSSSQQQRHQTTIPFNAIAAMSAETRGIGKNNRLPWSIPEDYAYYMRVIRTTRDPAKVNAVILGRLTWQSMPEDERPHRSCITVIVSRNFNPSDIASSDTTPIQPVEVCGSLDEAKRLIYAKYAHRVESMYSLGGGELYGRAALSPDFHRFYLTRVFGPVECDVFIEPVDFLAGFRRVHEHELAQEAALYQCEYNKLKKHTTTDSSSTPLEYIFEVYEKIKN